MLQTIDGKSMPPLSASFLVYYNQIAGRMSDAGVVAAANYVDALIANQKQDEVHVASWLPGADWSGTDLQPIWTACVSLYPNGDPHEMSARFFGQLVRSRFHNHSDLWYCTLNEYVARSWIYFRATR
ncbi:hypothetical protein [Rhizobium sp. Leaf383]|uniref:hypothetical protein n=1 Tax=Rhizobium sp. Leaf383 TaxID=1736357 RepID=UPI000713D312|nr:hypothetical protein [Rhizobium sp. Leaf383]KQS75968.1 hypothetical protein ASG58_14175 [Rhizobium sp. Leaf383]